MAASLLLAFTESSFAYQRRKFQCNKRKVITPQLLTPCYTFFCTNNHKQENVYSQEISKIGLYVVTCDTQ
jgi:hypothetical protein